jgi:hypothetical protein
VSRVWPKNIGYQDSGYTIDAASPDPITPDLLRDLWNDVKSEKENSKFVKGRIQYFIIVMKSQALQKLQSAL